jgi:hypothetical protein
VQPQGLRKLITIIHLIGSRTRDLPVCNIADKEELNVELSIYWHIQVLNCKSTLFMFIKMTFMLVKELGVNI